MIWLDIQKDGICNFGRVVMISNTSQRHRFFRYIHCRMCNHHPSGFSPDHYMWRCLELVSETEITKSTDFFNSINCAPHNYRPVISVICYKRETWPFKMSTHLQFQPRYYCLQVSLAGTLVSAGLTSGSSRWLIDLLRYEKVEGNIYRQIIILSCSLIYFLRFTICMFVFLQRKISWFEGGLVSFLIFHDVLPFWYFCWKSR